MASAEHQHGQHAHKHGQGCGHIAVRHHGHTDYLHDGHLHHAHGDHVDEHAIEIDANAPERCQPTGSCAGHKHGPDCGHPSVPHGSHTDYLVKGRLHHAHGDHCDDHGKIELA